MKCHANISVMARLLGALPDIMGKYAHNTLRSMQKQTLEV
jgi:hypothetical protein